MCALNHYLVPNAQHDLFNLLDGTRVRSYICLAHGVLSAISCSGELVASHQMRVDPLEMMGDCCSSGERIGKEVAPMKHEARSISSPPH